jgi:hypothetical protein
MLKKTPKTKFNPVITSPDVKRGVNIVNIQFYPFISTPGVIRDN